MEAVIKKMAEEYFHILIGDEETLECVSFKEDDGASSYLGTHSKAVSGEIMCKTKQHYLSELVFIKYYTASTQSYDFDLRPSFENEIYFYRKICPFLHSIRSIDHLVPKFLASTGDSNLDGQPIAIMMRRLGPEWKCHFRESLDLSHMSMMMRKLGEFHAYSFAAKRSDPNKFRELSEQATNTVVTFQVPAYCPKLVPILQRGLLPLRSDPQYREAVARIDRILLDFADQVTQSFSAKLGVKFSILGHLSYNQSNVLFRYADGSPADLKIMDWQTPSISRLGADLMRTLYSDTDWRIRDLHWDRLLDDYYQALSSTFENCDTPSRADILDELKHCVCAALFPMAQRVLSCNRETESAHPVWNEGIFLDMFKELIDRGLL